MKLDLDFNKRTPEIVELYLKKGPEFVKRQFNREYSNLQKQKNEPSYKEKMLDLLDAYNDLSTVNNLAFFFGLSQKKSRESILSEFIQDSKPLNYISKERKSFSLEEVQKSLDDLVKSYKVS